MGRSSLKPHIHSSGSKREREERDIRAAHTRRVRLDYDATVRQGRLGNEKGCDIGYAPAISSCEEANSVNTRTVAALDAITAFAVPNPNCPSQDQSVFSGLVALQVAL
jgi:hypothetical protein